MLRLISPKRADRILERHSPWIRRLSERYGVPEAALKAILYQEMTMMNLGDAAADLVVLTGAFHKKDSSTGYAQIFGRVGLNAANYAVDRGLATYDSLGIPCSRRLSPNDTEDVRLVWRKLHRDEKANMEFATLNLLACAEEMTGRVDFASYSPNELKLVFTRYNADVSRITPYGEKAYERYLHYLECKG